MYIYAYDTSTKNRQEEKSRRDVVGGWQKMVEQEGGGNGRFKSTRQRGES